MPRDCRLHLRHEGAIGRVEWRANRGGNLGLAFYRRSDTDRRNIDGLRRDESLAKPSSEGDEILDAGVELTHVERLRQIVVGAAVQTSEALIDAGVRGEQNDRQKVRVRIFAERAH